VKTVKIKDSRSFSRLFVRGGDGGAGGLDGGAGANVSGLKITALGGELDVLSGAGGDSDGLGNGGTGGGISTTKGRASVFHAIAGNGGMAISGAGGAGGDVGTVTFAASLYAQQIRAGAGGNSAAASGGTGGSVTDVKINGDIGNFFVPFGIENYAMGGLFAGAGGDGGTDGVAGSVSNVTAKRIAAILAVNEDTTPDNLSALNAVTQISGISTAAIGADLDKDGIADNSVGTTYQLGDTAIDGLVIVKTTGLASGGLKPDPLLVIAL
jgi:hypothetical protein